MALNCKTAYLPVFGVNISQTVGLRTAVARLPLRQLGFLVCCTGRRVWNSLIMTNGRIWCIMIFLPLLKITAVLLLLLLLL